MLLRRGKFEMDMTSGSLLPKILMFSLPLMFSSILQLLFNAADVIIVGRFAENGELALAAVGSTGALSNLIINVFLGLSIGANVLIARCLGAGDIKAASESAHTAVAVSVLGGVVLAVIGYFCSETFLIWMGSPDEVRPLATLYMKIYFIGMPVSMLYNFCAAVLRSIGDTVRPLIFLAISGVVNVALNMIFVIFFGMSVDGVALATIISQAISAALVLICLVRSETAVKIYLNKLRVIPSRLLEIARIGLPAGFQGACFSLSNTLIQSAVNSFGATVMAGNSISGNIEGFIYVAMNALSQASTTFTSQNVGAKKYDRVWKVFWMSALTAAAFGIVLGGAAMLFRYPLLGVYSDDAAVIAKGAVRMNIIVTMYFICGIMDAFCGSLRGLGKMLTPMVVSLAGACVFRILWVWFILPLNHTQVTLYISYPISWFITGATHMICFFVAMKKNKSVDKR